MIFNSKLLIFCCAFALASQAQVSKAESSYGSSKGKSATQSESSESESMKGESEREPASESSTMGTTGTKSEQSASGKQTAKTSQGMAIKAGQDYQVLEFSGGTSQLSDSAKTSLRKLIDNAKAQGEINNVHVAVWSDKPFPSGEGAQLAETDRTLADQRIDTIENYLKNTLNVDDVDTYSMAETSNWFARAFNTQEAELKSFFAQEGAPSDVDPQEFKIVREKGGPMKAVILLDRSKSASGSQRGPASATSPSMTGTPKSQREPSSILEDDSYGEDMGTPSGNE